MIRENDTTAGPAQRLVGGGGHDISKRRGVGMLASRDEAGEVGHASGTHPPHRQSRKWAKSRWRGTPDQPATISFQAMFEDRQSLYFLHVSTVGGVVDVIGRDVVQLA